MCDNAEPEKRRAAVPLRPPDPLCALAPASRPGVSEHCTILPSSPPPPRRCLVPIPTPSPTRPLGSAMQQTEGKVLPSPWRRTSLPHKANSPPPPPPRRRGPPRCRHSLPSPPTKKRRSCPEEGILARCCTLDARACSRRRGRWCCPTPRKGRLTRALARAMRSGRRQCTRNGSLA